jgi:hypothetical protein
LFDGSSITTYLNGWHRVSQIKTTAGLSLSSTPHSDLANSTTATASRHSNFSSYGYDLSPLMAYVFMALFAVSAVVHAYQVAKWVDGRWMSVMAI